MATDALSAARLRRVLDAAGECSHVQALPTVLEALAGVVACDVLFWNGFRLHPLRELAVVAQHGHEPARAPLEGWVRHLPEHPVMSGRHGPVVSVSDVLSPRAFERTWMYQNAFHPAGVRHEIGVELSHPSDGMSIVVLSRTGPRDFDDQDHLCLELLRPHLDAAVRRSLVARPTLTRRQIDVLRLVRDGCTDAQVARRTGLAEDGRTSTVRERSLDRYEPADGEVVLTTTSGRATAFLGFIGRRVGDGRLAGQEHDICAGLT